MRTIYIDVNGVCLRRAPGSRTGVELAPYGLQFLRWATTTHTAFWLTTRDAHSTHDGIIRAFRLAMDQPVLDPEVERLLRSVRPTAWSGSKVSGIDLTEDFIWIDDDPLAVEIDELRRANMLDRLVVVDTERDDDALLGVMRLLHR